MSAPRLLVTRAEPDASATAELIRAQGAIPLTVPLAHAEAIDSPLPDRPDRLIATSANALRLGAPLPPEWLALAIHCVGGKTAEAAHAAGFADVRVAGGDVSALIGEIAGPELATLSFAYLASEPRRPDLEAFFAEAGLPLAVVERYRMVRLEALPEAIIAALDAGTIDAVLHFSAESARHFCALAQAAGRLAAALQPLQACLSPAVAQPIAAAARRRAIGVNAIFPARPEAEALVARALAGIGRPQFD